ncbi:ComEA family DNA-binding protein [Saccharopolyspora taberi]|uniref:ComEA family DNA-binding protein n=1 Tax=Saccharopolyspora taberi TaxID=60895 RepID=A0ABN3V4Z3_9PSEU
MSIFSLFRATSDPADEPTGPQQRLDSLRMSASRDSAEERAGPGYSVSPPTRRKPMHRMARRWLPPSWLESRVDPGRAGLIALSVAALVLLGVVGLTAWTSRPEAEPVPQPPVAPPVLSPTSSSPPAELVVSVVGRVSRPGLVTVRPGDRVADALEQAGGTEPDVDITALNLARRLADGEQLYVGVPVPPGQPGNSSAGPADKRLDLNTATEEQLDELPGVGEVTAQRIVQWRTENGRFNSVDQLREVGGIGDTRFSRLRDLVRT